MSTPQDAAQREMSLAEYMEAWAKEQPHHRIVKDYQKLRDRVAWCESTGCLGPEEAQKAYDEAGEGELDQALVNSIVKAVAAQPANEVRTYRTCQRCHVVHWHESACPQCGKKNPTPAQPDDATKLDVPAPAPLSDEEMATARIAASNEVDRLCDTVAYWKQRAEEAERELGALKSSMAGPDPGSALDYLRELRAKLDDLAQLREENERLRGATEFYVFRCDGPPSHESGRFVELEDETGRGLGIGEWKQDGEFWNLWVPRGDAQVREENAALREEKRALEEKVADLLRVARNAHGEKCICVYCEDARKLGIDGALHLPIAGLDKHIAAQEGK